MTSAIQSEEWKKIKDSPYSISNLGRCRNDRTGKALRLYSDKNGYLCVNLLIQNRLKHKRVHRLVAQHFLSTPEDCCDLQVNHLNGNKTDNRVINLEWCTCYENLQHAYDTGLHEIKPVEMLDEEGNVLKTFKSTRDAGRYLGVTNSSVSSACRKHNLCRGYAFRFVNSVQAELIYTDKRKCPYCNHGSGKGSDRGWYWTNRIRAELLKEGKALIYCKHCHNRFFYKPNKEGEAE